MIFIISGGSGSTHITNIIEAFGPFLKPKLSLHNRIDVCMKPHWFKQDNINPIMSLEDKPTSDLIKDFKYRTEMDANADRLFELDESGNPIIRQTSNKSYLLDEKLSMRENMIKYYEKVDSDDEIFSLSCGFLSYFDFYIKSNIKKINYLLRNPLTHSIAYLGPQKNHGVELERDYHSIFTKKGLDIYIKYYGKVVSDAFQLREKGRANIYFYEDTLSHVDWNNPTLDKAFNGWKPSNKHSDILNEEQQDYITKNIPYFNELWGRK